MHYYKRNLGDYAKKAGRLSMLQHGAYTLLIDACYDREQFPTLEDAIEWTWASSPAETDAVKFVLSRFFTLENGVYIQKRIQEEIEEYRIKAETNTRIAKERESRRKDRAQAVHESCTKSDESSPNHKPRTNNQEPDTSTSQPDARDPQKFQMHVNWKPSEEFPTLAKMAMVKLQDGKLGEFVAHWLTRPDRRTQAEWDKALLQSILHDKARGHSPPRTPQREKFEEKDYGKGGRL